MFELGAGDAKIGVLGFGRLELRFGLSNRFIGGDAGIKKHRFQSQRFAIGHNGRIEAVALSASCVAELVVIDGHLRLRGQPRIGKSAALTWAAATLARTVLRTRPHRSGTLGRVERKRVNRAR